jgi:hypothetical protein
MRIRRAELREARAHAKKYNVTMGFDAAFGDITIVARF